MKKSIIFICFLLSVSFLHSQEKESIRIKNLPINSKYSDFGVGFYKNKIVFSSARTKRSLVKRRWEPNQQPYLNLYMVDVSDIASALDAKTTVTKVAKKNEPVKTEEELRKVSNKVKKAKKSAKKAKSKKKKSKKDKVSIFSKTLNTKYHESSVAFSPDYNTIYFTRDKYLNGKLAKSDAEGKVVLNLYKATNVGGKWTNIVALPFNSHLYSAGHPSVSADGKTLYFISDMPGGLGGTDIYKVAILGDNQYGTPKNLGKKVNTEGMEMFPFVDENEVLYFSSDGRKDSMGGLDIYGVSQSKTGVIGDVIHLEAPINSVSDDFAFVKESGKSSGYFSSNRYGGYGDDDIYSFSGAVVKKKCMSLVTGKVLDKNTKVALANAKVVVYDSVQKKVKEFITDGSGTFQFPSSCKLAYKIVAEKTGYQPSSKVVKTKEGKVFLDLLAEQNKAKSVVELPNILSESDVSYDNRGRLLINIENIYYDTNKHNIRLSERPKLNRLIEIMRKYPDIQVEIGAHTDCRGSASYNMSLSDRRAKSARRYVISGGISSSRIFGRGYGEGHPVNDCDCRRKCTQEEYQANRRTEFVIINR